MVSLADWIPYRHLGMDSSTISKSPPKNGEIYCICDNAYHKQELCFPLFKLGQIVILP